MELFQSQTTLFGNLSDSLVGVDNIGLILKADFLKNSLDTTFNNLGNNVVRLVRICSTSLLLGNFTFFFEIFRIKIIGVQCLRTHSTNLHAEIVRQFSVFTLNLEKNADAGVMMQISTDRTFNTNDSFNFEVEGSTTSSFDSVKQFYLDVYEALGNLLVIPVALNNIKYRADANSMNPLEKNVSSLEDYIKLTKASRYHFCLNTEVYTDFLDVVVNAKLRNAIGHNDVEYDAVSQVITYIPNPKDRTVKKTEYLLEFENEAMHMFQALLGVSEYLYRLRELSLMYDGKIPLMVQERANWPKKIGRNDPCPCGSGKKYKFCHGKN